MTLVRAVLLCCVISLALPANSSSLSSRKLNEFVLSLIDRGVTPAHITIEYSLDDDCSLADLRVTENSHPEEIVADIVSEVVKVRIGPFSFSNDELLQSASDGLPAPRALAMQGQSIHWNTADGHRLIVCRFHSNGELKSARLTDGYGQDYVNKIEDQNVTEPLSELGNTSLRVTFAAGVE